MEEQMKVILEVALGSFAPTSSIKGGDIATPEQRLQSALEASRKDEAVLIRALEMRRLRRMASSKP